MHRQVFISYSSKDRREAEQVRAYLEDNDVSCWIAPRDMACGEHFITQIERAIVRADVAVLLMSESASRSRYVEHELRFAIEQGKSVLVLRLGDVRASAKVEQLLAACQHVDLRGPLFARNVPQVLCAVRQLLSTLEPAQAPSAANTPQAEPEASRAGILIPSP